MMTFTALALSAFTTIEATKKPVPKLAISGLAYAITVPDLCLYRYRTSTPSEECQKFCDQGFGYYYSYVWIEAVRNFETALQHDPQCAMAWLGLHKSLEKWGKTTAKPLPYFAALGTVIQPKLPDSIAKAPHDYALEMAKQLLPKASHREGFLITAKLQEKGMLPGVGDERRKKAQQTLDELLAIYEDDEEGWFARAQLGDGTHGAIVFYKALLRLNPYHPGANHELVHTYENVRRPALGWPYAEGYIRSSPGLPHAFHMQAHLGMRVGKWAKTTDYSWHAIELQREYHKLQNVKPDEDHQFSHHLETLTRSLIHDGRFREAKQIRTEAEGYKYHYRQEWFRMATSLQEWADAEELVSKLRKGDKVTAAYFAAILAIERGDLERAKAEIDTMQHANQSKRGERQRELRLWEAQGRYACKTGNGDAGIKLLKRTIDKTKDDYAHHAWGGGAYFMESWGRGALDAGQLIEAREAYQEALAHDSGSVRGALGMWSVCTQSGEPEEAARYLKLAQRCWQRAESSDFERLKATFAGSVGASGASARLKP